MILDPQIASSLIGERKKVLHGQTQNIICVVVAVVTGSRDVKGPSYSMCTSYYNNVNLQAQKFAETQRHLPFS